MADANQVLFFNAHEGYRVSHPIAGGDASLDLVADGSHSREARVWSKARARVLPARWTLAEIAGEVGHSPVYLTQVFQQVEGLPLYRYHRRLRLARSLDLLSQYDDLTALSLDLGFYSHSHFTTAFKQTYGRPPSAFRLAGPHR